MAPTVIQRSSSSKVERQFQTEHHACEGLAGSCFHPIQSAWPVTAKTVYPTRLPMSIYSYVQHRQAFCGRLRCVTPGRNCPARNAPQPARGRNAAIQLRLIQQVLERLEGANEKAYQGRDPLHFCDSCVPAEVSQVIDVRS